MTAHEVQEFVLTFWFHLKSLLLSRFKRICSWKFLEDAIYIHNSVLLFKSYLIDVIYSHIGNKSRCEMAENEPEIEVGDRLGYVRGQLGLSQKEVGKILGLPWRRYQTWEVGTRSLSYENLMKFCRAFGVRPEWVMEGEEPIRSFVVKDIVDEVVGAVELELERQSRMFVTGDYRKVASKMVASRIKNGEINRDELSNYVELVGKKVE